MYCNIPPIPDVFCSLLVTNMWSLRWIILSSLISPLLQRSYAEQAYQSNGIIKDFTGIELMLKFDIEGQAYYWLSSRRYLHGLFVWLFRVFGSPWRVQLNFIWVFLQTGSYICILPYYIASLQMFGIDSDFNRYLCNYVVCILSYGG